MPGITESPAAQMPLCDLATLQALAQNYQITQLQILLPVDLPQHNINAPNRRHYVRKQSPFTHLWQQLEIGEACRPHVHSVWLSSPVADHVVTHFAAR